MKSITVRDLQKSVKDCVDSSQKERVVVTRHGRPAAVLVGVEGSDWEDLFYQSSPGFWKMIFERRRQKSSPLADVIKRLKKRK